MKDRLRILHLEDDPDDALLVQETLEADGVACRITRVDTEATFIASLEQGDFDLILADYTLPSFDGLHALQLAKQARSHVPFIFVSGTLGEEVAIDALKIGATDYVFKTRLSRIVPSVQRALREAEERAELSRAEEALRQSEAYLAEGQRLSQAGSFGWSVSSGDIYWSRETFRIYECDPSAKVTLELIMQHVHPDDRAAVHELIDRASREGMKLDYEHRLLFPDGSVKHVHVIARPVTDDSRGLGYIGAIQDVTQRRRADEALRHAQAELARVARLTTMGELTASLAHEINQPLAAIMTNGLAGLRWLTRETPDLAEARSALHHIVRDAARAGDVIRGIRALAMKSDPQLNRLDIDDVIREVLALTRTELHQHGVALHTELATVGRPVLGDRVQLQQVLLNLILNGIDAMKPVTDRARELTVSTEFREPVGLLVAVEDTGMGLDPAVAQRIFEPFFTTKSDGLGMGLSICRSIVGAHGGRLWASPRSPCGTALQFTIPLAG
jgi:signal transduction histidine kinase/DNA-binding response OmpR family regulator